MDLGSLDTVPKNKSYLPIGFLIACVILLILQVYQQNVLTVLFAGSILAGFAYVSLRFRFAGKE